MTERKSGRPCKKATPSPYRTGSFHERLAVVRQAIVDAVRQTAPSARWKTEEGFDRLRMDVDGAEVCFRIDALEPIPFLRGGGEKRRMRIVVGLHSVRRREFTQTVTGHVPIEKIAAHALAVAAFVRTEKEESDRRFAALQAVYNTGARLLRETGPHFLAIEVTAEAGGRLRITVPDLSEQQAREILLELGRTGQRWKEDRM